MPLRWFDNGKTAQWVYSLSLKCAACCEPSGRLGLKSDVVMPEVWKRLASIEEKLVRHSSLDPEKLPWKDPYYLFPLKLTIRSTKSVPVFED